MNTPKLNPYLILNLFFIGLILSIFTYSIIFSAEKDNHPVPSYNEKFAGRESPTSGLSRSFSEIIRGNFKEGKAWNNNGIQIFLFFLIQLFLRFATSFFVIKKTVDTKKLAWIDSIISLVLFLICFKNLLAFWKFF